ncbi:MAG: hypothetical protein HYX51_03875 [Chloroflexi bacterium]|nr:hypothetical protein [Chloroflexota bacterium]
MPSPLALAQFARMVGSGEFLAAVGLPAGAGVPASLSDEQRAAARVLAGTHVDTIAHALADEIRANDDIQDAASADVYLDERLVLFAPLLTDDVRERIRGLVREATASWR